MYRAFLYLLIDVFCVVIVPISKRHAILLALSTTRIQLGPRHTRMPTELHNRTIN